VDLEVGAEDETYLRARSTMVAAGVADLLLVDDTGDVVASVEVPVHFPTHAELHAAAPVFLGREDVPADTPRPRVLAGGEATFLVRYYDGDTRLYGNGALDVVAGERTEAWVAHSYLFEDRDWLKVRPDELGPDEVELLAGGRSFSTVEVEGVGPEAVSWVELHGDDESKAEAGDNLLVIAQAHADDAAPIYGVEYAWDIGGRDETGLGDMYRYEYDPDARATLVADFEGARAQADIRGVDGYVDSSNAVGCRVGGPPSTPGWALGLLALVAVATRWRRTAFALRTPEPTTSPGV
jgi:MYXO-CTERM domain-containing protein